MPWSPKSATKFTRKADTPEKQRQWSEIANDVLERTGSEAQAIKAANAAVADRPARKGK
jgi:hypothetical protein